jgi:hypothetical protein
MSAFTPKWRLTMNAHEKVERCVAPKPHLHLWLHCGLTKTFHQIPERELFDHFK